MHELDPGAALELFETAFKQEAMGMALRAVDPCNPRWLRVNDKLCEMLGYSREELLRLTSIDVTLPEEREESDAYNRRLLSGVVRSYSREKRYVRKDGRVVWANVWLSAVPGSDGTPGVVICMVQDITERKRAEGVLQEAENRFRSVVDSAPAGITLKDRDGRFLVVNRTYARWMQVAPADLIGRTPHELFPKDQADEIRADDMAILDSGRETSREALRTFGDGVTRTVISYKSPVRSAEGDPVAVSTVITDITARVRAEAAVRERERRFKDFAESASDWFWETDASLRFTYLSSRFYERTGIDRSGGDLSLESAAGELSAGTGAEGGALAKAIAAREPFKDLEHSVRGRDGTVRHARISGTPVFSEDGRFRGYRGTGTDITESHNLATQLAWHASHDGLTGLINRREFERCLGRDLESAAREGGEHALCYVDLDQFKVINDTCGHVAGDELLRQLGQVLPTAVRRGDTLARLGGDEFGLLLAHCTVEQAQRVVGTLRETIAEFRFDWEGQSFRIGASIGLVPLEGQGWSVGEALRAADSACYAAKEAGRNRVHVYHPEDAEISRRHGEMKWVARIGQALEEDRFQLWSQPIVPARPGAAQGEHFEVLVRMVDEKGESVPPGAFLPAAERYGLSTQIDRWVIDAVLAWLSRNPRRLSGLAQCAINISGASLGDEEVLRFTQERLSEAGVPPEKICFEITETAAVGNLARALDFMTALKDIGCSFSLDDFGSGLSSFRYLKTLPVDFLKIDGAFVKDVLVDPVDLALVRSINDVGKVMGKQTIAEFVESPAILERMREIGVDFVQGFGVGRPRPLDEDG